jgi:hypothetical protein
LHCGVDLTACERCFLEADLLVIVGLLIRVAIASSDSLISMQLQRVWQKHNVVKSCEIRSLEKSNA